MNSMNPEFHDCECGHRWRHGQSGAHDCGPYYRQTIRHLRDAAAAPQVVADERAVLNEIADLFSIGAEARKEPGVILANVRNTVKFANLLHAVEREFFMSPDDENECLLNCWGSTTEQYLAAISSVLQAAPVQAQEPVAYLKFWAEQSWSGNGNHDIDYGEGLEVCEAGEIGADKLPDFPVYRASVQPVAVPDGPSAEDYSDMLRAFFFNYAAGGYNDAGGLVPLETVKDKLEWIVNEAIQHAAPAAQGDSTQAEKDVLAERRRQIDVEGRTTESDDRHIDCQLARAAATYALCTEPGQLKLQGITVWPWGPHWWKFTDYRRNLVKSGALILAEIERIDRAAIAAKAAS